MGAGEGVTKMADERLSNDELVALGAVLLVALLGALPRKRSDRLLVAASVAFRRINRIARLLGIEPAAVARAEVWWSRVLPALIRTAR